MKLSFPEKVVPPSGRAGDFNAVVHAEEEYRKWRRGWASGGDSNAVVHAEERYRK